MSLQDSSLHPAFAAAPAASPLASAVRRRAAVRAWLFAVAALIFVMVLVGGATRLTESGLSITQWKPVTGVIPPLSAGRLARREFERYQQIPQYRAAQRRHDARGLQDHLLVGMEPPAARAPDRRGLRSAGAVVLVRAASCEGALGGAWLRRRRCWRWSRSSAGGWSSSGLAERTEVAQDRLAIHLLIAAATFAALIYAGGRSGRAAGASGRRRLRGGGYRPCRRWCSCQLGLGALVAGLRAGRIYNTWPTMDGSWLPSETVRPLALAALDLDDATTAQFDHRIVAYAVVACGARACVRGVARGAGHGDRPPRAASLACVALAQAALGIVHAVCGRARSAWRSRIRRVALLLFGLAVAHASATSRDRAAA